MARQLKRLTARSVAAKTRPGRHADGGNLYLTISKTGAGISKRWTFMYSFAGHQREAGFGSVAAVTLAEARDKAAGYRSLLAKGIDPLNAKKAGQDAAAARKTFGQCADELLAAKSSQWRNEKHRAQWRMTLETYAAPLRSRPVDEIDTEAVLGVLQPLWRTTPETAARLRGRIEAVLDAARAKGYIPRNEANPARWRGHLDKLLPKRQKLSRGHHAAMAFDDVPKFIATLREREAVAAFALEFLILTAARSGEVLGARWAEFDLEGKVWTVPAARMKGAREHRVPLSSRAVEIIARLAAIRVGDFVFAGQRRGRPLSGVALSKLCPAGATTHGFRSSFRDWCGEVSSAPREIAEQALAHAAGDATERAYRRGDALEKRRALMEAWANYCEPSRAGNVVALRG